MTRGDDIAWCYDAVTEVSRTFAITVAELEEPMAREVCVGYLVCRVADTVEDDRHVPPGEKADLLRAYDAALAPGAGADAAERFQATATEWAPADPGPDWGVVLEAPRVLRSFRGLDPAARDCIRPPTRALVGGMVDFVDRYAADGGLRVRTLAELEEYCEYVAGTVGDLVTNLLAREAADPVVARLEEHARSFGLLLQLVNVAKDVGTDYAEENNVYLPAEWLSEAGVEPAELGDPDAAERVAPVVERVTERAASYLDGAQAWLEAMPTPRGNTLSAWAIPFLLAVGTIRELERRPTGPVQEGNVKIPRAEVEAVMARFEAGVTAEDLDRLRKQMRERPLHEW